jgi:hypothetical protein
MTESTHSLKVPLEQEAHEVAFVMIEYLPPIHELQTAPLMYDPALHVIPETNGRAENVTTVKTIYSILHCCMRG